MRRAALRYLIATGFHTLAWTEWGPETGLPVICVHGLTRNGRDFDVLAEALAARGRRVICPDLPGRGASDWLSDPALYNPPTYLAALSHLLARLDGKVDWVGTSLGGICGMAIAALPGQPIRRQVLNDVGPCVHRAALERIGAYLEATPDGFADLAALEGHLREVHAPFGPLSDAEWRHMAEHSARRLPDGRLALHYDPAIVVPFRAQETADLELWGLWEAGALPTLVLHGAESDVLDAPTASRMAERPGTRLVTLEGIGHAPALLDPGQVALVAEFLTAA